MPLHNSFLGLALSKAKRLRDLGFGAFFAFDAANGVAEIDFQELMHALLGGCDADFFQPRREVQFLIPMTSVSTRLIYWR